jgi:hypothetical protein
MEDSDLDQLTELLSSPRAGDRLRGMDRISTKTGGSVARRLDDPRVVPLLIEGLRDSNRRVQRAAARGLRPWVATDPAVLDSALTAYTTDHFDGSYSHAGLYDTRNGAIWIPRLAALRGHAALLRDGNTDRYFKFEFFLAAQSPNWIPCAAEAGHLVLYFIPEWSYSRQRLIPEYDDRLAKASRREQDLFGREVVAFYRRAALPYVVMVHRILGGGGYHRSREFDVDRIDARRPTVVNPSTHEVCGIRPGNQSPVN